MQRFILPDLALSQYMGIRQEEMGCPCQCKIKFCQVWHSSVTLATEYGCSLPTGTSKYVATDSIPLESFLLREVHPSPCRRLEVRIGSLLKGIKNEMKAHPTPYDSGSGRVLMRLAP